MYITSVRDLDVDNILLDEKSYKNSLNCDVAYKPPYFAKPLRLRKYDRTKYLALQYFRRLFL